MWSVFWSPTTPSTNRKVLFKLPEIQATVITTVISRLLCYFQIHKQASKTGPGDRKSQEQPRVGAEGQHGAAPQSFLLFWSVQAWTRDTTEAPREMMSELTNAPTGAATPHHMALRTGVRLSLLCGGTAKPLTSAVPAGRPPPSPQSLAGHGSHIPACPPE